MHSADDTSESMFEVVIGLLEKMHWMILNQVASTTDGASSMTRHCTGLATRMHVEVSTLMNVHYITHHEALATRDVARVFSRVQMLDCFANIVYDWVGCSTDQRNELKRLLKDVFKKDYLVVLQIHAVRWFS